MTRIKLINQGLLALIFIISLANIYFVACEFKINYEGRNGIVLKNGMTLGGDFLAFYTGASMYKNDRENLYNYFKQKEFQENLSGNQGSTTGFLQFVYPPLFAAVISPLGSMSFEQAYFTWAGIMLFLYTSGVLIFLYNLTEFPKIKYLTLIYALGFPPFVMWGLAGGQSSAIGVFLISLICTSVNKQKLILAGLFSTLFYYKPPCVVFLVLFLIFTKHYKYFLSILAFSTLLFFLTLYESGVEGISSYLSAAATHTYGESHEIGFKFYPVKGAGIYAILYSISEIFRQNSKFFLLLLNVICLYRLIKFKGDDKIIFLVVSLSLLLSIHLVIYDTSLYILPMIYFILNKYFRSKDISLHLILLLFFSLMLTYPEIKFSTHSISSVSILNLILCILASHDFFSSQKAKALK